MAKFQYFATINNNKTVYINNFTTSNDRFIVDVKYKSNKLNHKRIQSFQFIVIANA